MSASGWAVVRNNKINVRTVSPSRQAAIVNWLCVECGMLLTDLATEYQIDQEWESNGPPVGADVVQVTIVRSEQ
jgi:hypothetical protein